MSLKLAYSTDNWRPEWWSVEKCFARIKELGGKYVELTTATGYNLLEGLGFSPYVSIDHDPYLVRDLSAKYGLEIVSIDADWPIWSHNCIEVLNKTIVWADMLGCRTIITTDSDKYPEGRTDEEWFDIIRYHLSCVLPVAKRHNVKIALEPHGYLTTKPESLLRLVTQNNSDMIGINFDTGNSFIAGQDPVAFLESRQGTRDPHAHQGRQRAAGRGDDPSAVIVLCMVVDVDLYRIQEGLSVIVSGEFSCVPYPILRQISIGVYMPWYVDESDLNTDMGLSPWLDSAQQETACFSLALPLAAPRHTITPRVHCRRLIRRAPSRQNPEQPRDGVQRRRALTKRSAVHDPSITTLSLRFDTGFRRRMRFLPPWSCWSR